jgi:2-phosphoglycolate phosphatase
MTEGVSIDVGRLQAILLDFDYTLADSSRGVIDCIDFALSALGLPPVSNEAACRTIGLSLPNTLVQLAGPQHADKRDAFTRLFVQRSDEVMAENTVLFPWTAGAIRALKGRGLALGIVSTKYRRRIEAVLEREHLLDLFDVIVGGEDVPQHKPDPASLLQALERLGVRPENALYVGDSVTDAEAANRGAIPFVAVLSGTTTREDLQDHDVYRMIDSLGHLPDLVSQTCHEEQRVWIRTSDDSALEDGEPLLSVGLLTDTHYADRTYGNRYCHDSLAKLRACIDAFNGRRLELAIHLGDAVDGSADREAELAGLEEIGGAFAAFWGQSHIVLGNHDLGSLTKHEFLQHCGIPHAAPYYSFDHKGIHLVLLDSNCHEDGSDCGGGDFEWDKTWISSTQIEWLERDLAAAHSRPTIVCCHGNLDDRLWQGALDPHVVRNAAEVREVLERAGNVLAVISGHYHLGMHATVQGIPHVALVAMVEGAGLEHNAYGILSIYPEGNAILEGFGRQESLQIATPWKGGAA